MPRILGLVCALLALAGAASAQPRTPPDARAYARFFAEACLAYFPDLDRIRDHAKRTGWIDDGVTIKPPGHDRLSGSARQLFGPSMGPNASVRMWVVTGAPAHVIMISEGRAQRASVKSCSIMGATADVADATGQIVRMLSATKVANDLQDEQYHTERLTIWSFRKDGLDMLLGGFRHTQNPHGLQTTVVNDHRRAQ